MKIEVFDNSMLKLYRMCPRKFYWRMVEHLKPVDERDYIPAFGSAIHSALEVWYKDDGTFESALEAFKTKWSKYEGQDSKGNRCLKRGITLLMAYVSTYPKATEPFKIKYQEVGFTIDLGSIIYCGKIDALVEWMGILEGLFILEHKTSSAEGYLTTKPNSQLDGYIYAASEVTGVPVIGACLNQLYHLTKGEVNKFRRDLTHRDPEELEDWKADTLALAQVINSDNTWGKNTDSCGAFFRECEYKKICITKNTERQKLIEGFYIPNKWEPFEGARKGEKSNEKLG